MTPTVAELTLRAFPGSEPRHFLLRRAAGTLDGTPELASLAMTELNYGCEFFWSGALDLSVYGEETDTETFLRGASQDFLHAARRCAAAADDISQARVEAGLIKLDRLSERRARGAA